MHFVGDFHLHSRFSRATSRTLDLITLHQWAQRKGIAVVGTGDCTHPTWLAELKSSLVPAGEGVYRLRDDLARRAERDVAVRDPIPVRFLLTGEISNIYRDAERTRKVHSVLFAPSFQAVDRINAVLAKIGNLIADGRPILGVSVRDLLEIVLDHGLDADHAAFVIPAHIWTPWFSLFGAKSGYESIVECFGDLAPQVFAIETGLSADPPMCRRLSQLDSLALVSNSDAHSGSKLGREANLFDTEPDYPSIRSAWEQRDPQRFLGTIEFFPEEGKYHHDGHRKCGVRMTPAEAREHDGRCPVCGREMTRGVSSRVEELADRSVDAAAVESYEMLVPLAEVVGEVAQVGPSTKKVRTIVDRLAIECGNELDVLRRVPLEDVERAASSAVAEAIRRVRAGELRIEPGYDGVFGEVRIFSDGARARWLAAGAVFAGAIEHQPPTERASESTELSPEQAALVERAGDVAVIGGPGTGKSFVLAMAAMRRVAVGARVLLLAPHATGAQVLRRFMAAAGPRFQSPHCLTVGTLDEVDTLPSAGPFDFVGIDDAQEVDRGRARRLRNLLAGAAQTLVVGDPDQATVTVGRSGPAFFLSFTDRTDVHTGRLTRSFRSPESIIFATRRVIERAQIRWETRLWSGLDTPNAIHSQSCSSPSNEATWIAERIVALREDGYRPQDIAVFCRNTTRSIPIHGALRRHGIIAKRLSDDLVTLRSDVRRTLGKLARLRGESRVAAAERVALATSDSDLARLLVRLARPFGTDLDGFLERLETASDRTLFDLETPAVTVGTFSAAGAVEFPVVFLAGLERDVVPDPDKVAAGAEEAERRVFYLSATRARRRLYLTHALKKSIVGKRVGVQPSPFLTELLGVAPALPTASSATREEPSV